MNKLYYGHGECTIEGNAFLVIIKYSGAVEIRDITPKDYYISATNNKIIISPFRKVKTSLNRLFKYSGELRIISVKVSSVGEINVPTTIVRVMDYSELLNTNAEDMTNKSENLNGGYLSGDRVDKTRLLKKIIPDLHTSHEGSPNLLLNGENYFGSFHKHIGTGIIMTGSRHTRGSEVLVIGRERII